MISLAKAAARLGVTYLIANWLVRRLNRSEGQKYLGAMNAGINCALANRQIFTHLTRDAMQRIDPGVEDRHFI